MEITESEEQNIQERIEESMKIRREQIIQEKIKKRQNLQKMKEKTLKRKYGETRYW